MRSPGSTIRVAIVEDHVLYRDLLESSLQSTPDIEVVISVSGSTEAKQLIVAGNVDVAILDIELADGNGIGLGVTLRRNDPNLGILLLSGRDMIELLLGLPEEQRHGWSYLSKSSSASLETLLDVIRHTAAGKSVIDPALIDRSRARPGTPVSSLTRRQFEILRMVARGLSNQAIADEIGIAANSVVNHLSSIYSALGIAEGSNARVSAVLEFLSDTARAS
jgi:DNA-binding NarL/FixJ family response regulator